MALPPPGPTVRRPGPAPAVLAGVLLACAGLAACTTGSAGPAARTSAATAATSAASSPEQTTAPAPTGTDTGTGTGTGTGPSGSAPASSSPAAAPGTAGSTPASPPVVQITYSGWDPSSRSAQVNALVTDVVARDGQCTLTLSLNGMQKTATVTAHPTPQATSCGLMSVPGSQLAAGAWQAVVRFTSGEGDASSRPVTIQVPA